MARRSETYPCPHCGAELTPRASFCRECGSDASTGWSEDAESGGVDLPGPMEDRAYEEFLERELGQIASGSRGKRWLARLAMALLVIFVLWLILPW